MSTIALQVFNVLAAQGIMFVIAYYLRSLAIAGRTSDR